MPPDTAPQAKLCTPKSPAELFLTFTLLALQGFGGVLAVAQRELVDRKRWLTREEFVDLYSVSQLLPGPNVVNLSLMLGDRFFGLRGAMAAVAGMLFMPLVIVLTLAVGYQHFADLPRVAGALRGMGAVAAGLMIAMAIKLVPTLLKNPMGKTVCAALAVLTAFLVAWLRLPLAWVVPGVGLVGFTIAYLAIKRQQAQRSTPP